MPKTKTPFLSLGAQGSVGGSITAQRSPHGTILREKPLPSDPYSLPQAYQRWLYEDYAYLWTQQTIATQRTYSATGSRYHLTGFQYWMSFQLKNLPDIVLLVHLDNLDGALVLDKSRNANNGTAFGTVIAPGIIGNALSFDGINDYVNFGDIASFESSDFTLEALINTNASVGQAIFSKGQFDAGIGPTLRGYMFRIQGTSGIKDGDERIERAFNVSQNINHHVAITFDRSGNMGFWLDGTNTLNVSIASIGGITNPNDLRIGCYTNNPTYLPFGGIIDMAIIYNRALDATEITRHSLRRYPA